jgi:hypothetical protein
MFIQPTSQPPGTKFADRLRSNATDFLNDGIAMLFSANINSRTAKIAVVSIQRSSISPSRNS